MISPTSVRSCRDYGGLLGPFLDGELDTSVWAEVNDHVSACESCREHLSLQHATQGSLRREVRTVAPEGLKTRVTAAMLAELSRQNDRGAARSLSDTRSGWAFLGPLMAAAIVAIAAIGSVRKDSEAPRAARMGLGSDLLDDVIAEHAHPLPPERTDPKEVRAFEQYVGVPVRTAHFEKGGAHLVGGRMLPIHDGRAAMLQYELGNDRVSVVIYDPRKIRIDERDLSPRSVGNARVSVGHAQGYSVAVTERDGVGYVLASDLDVDRNAQLAVFAGED